MLGLVCRKVVAAALTWMIVPIVFVVLVLGCMTLIHGLTQFFAAVIH